jgi:prepilin-type processing-associated H-X9-DG protein
MGSGEVIPAYLAVSNFVTTFDRFVCPTDRLRHGARNGQPITTANVSYFISLDASPTNSATQTVLTGDRYLEANGSQVASGLLSLRANQPVTWMKGFHFVVSHPSGNFSFADGHAEVVKSAYLQRTITNQPIPVNRVVIP